MGRVTALIAAILLLAGCGVVSPSPGVPSANPTYRASRSVDPTVTWTIECPRTAEALRAMARSEQPVRDVVPGQPPAEIIWCHADSLTSGPGTAIEVRRIAEPSSELMAALAMPDLPPVGPDQACPAVYVDPTILLVPGSGEAGWFVRVPMTACRVPMPQVTVALDRSAWTPVDSWVVPPVR